MTTITDIAEALKISTATVSRALNQSRLVTPDLSARVNRKATEMGYQKRVIRRHSGRAILNIKLVLPYPREPERALFYDLASLITGIRAGFTRCGINLLCEISSPDFKPYPHKKGGDTNGFIFAFNRPTQSTIAEIRKIGTPYIVLNRNIPGMPCVALENARGMANLIDHLHSRRPDLKPAFVTLSGLGQIGKERLEGMATACGNLSLPFDAKRDTFQFDGISSITSETVRPLVAAYNALVCANDIIGNVVSSELDRMGIAIPAQCAVTGFDNSPVRNLSRPLLTTVDMCIGKLATTAASRLESEIIEQVPTEEIIRIPGTLMVGEST